MAAGVSSSTLRFTKYGFQVLFECEFFNTQPSSNSRTQAFSFCEFLKSCSSSWSHELIVYVFANGRKEWYTKKPYPSDDTEVYLFWWDWFTSWDELKKNYSKAVNITFHCQLLQLIVPVHTQTHNHQFWAICFKSQQQPTGCCDDLLHLLRNISWLWKSRKYKTCEMDSTSSTTSMDFWRPQIMHLELGEARKTWGYAGCSDMQRKKTYWRISIGNSRKRKTQVGKCLKKKELGVLTQGQDSLWFLGWCLKYVWTHLRWVLRVQSRILWPPSC